MSCECEDETCCETTEPAFEAEELARVYKALGHPARLRIIEYLKKETGCICGDIVDALPLAQSTVSQHLKILKEAGLIEGETEGPRTCYCLVNSVFDKFKRTTQEL